MTAENTTIGDENRSAADMLVGKELDNNWVVVEKIERPETATGGHFSVGYIIKDCNSKKTAFLKALDYSIAFRSKNTPEMLKAMTSAFVYECSLLDICGQKKLSKIVTAIERGHVDLPNIPGYNRVDYLIFEKATADVRAYIDQATGFDLAWALRTLHNITVGLTQLHGQHIAHQDLKPSNVLVFQQESKLADLGRAIRKGDKAPHENLKIAGDKGYAPPELLYGKIDDDWNARRFGVDAYHLGSLVAFFFMNAGVTPLLLTALPDEYCPAQWDGDYEEVLPYLQKSFAKVMELFEAQQVPDWLRTEISNVIRQLCDPDPKARGHPKNRWLTKSRYSLERYVSIFDRLALRARLAIK